MKNRRAFVLCLLLCLFLPFGSVLAEDATIHRVDIHATLMQDGSAEIQEQWDVTVTSGTEWYLSLNGMQGMPVTDLSVSDESGAPYALLEQWDTDRTLEQKANTCGILRKGDSDYELCWGVGSYGRHQFTVSYTITGLVKRYSDAVGFNHTFLSKELSSAVEQATVTLSYPDQQLYDDNADIWAFGFDGEVGFSNGGIAAQSNSRITKKEGIILMAAFDPALFSDAQDGSGSFEAVKEKAFAGSDYGESNDGPGPLVWGIMGGIAALGIFAAVFAGLRSTLPDVYYRKAYGLSRADLKQGAEARPQLPFDGDLRKTAALLDLFHEKPSQVSIFNYYLLKWIREKAVTESNEGTRDPHNLHLRFAYPAYGADPLEEQLYGMLVAAANQGELTQKEIEKWAAKKQAQIDRWYKDYIQKAAEDLRLEELTTQAHVRRAFVSATIDVLNEKGWQHATEVYGFKNYLIQCSQGQYSDIPQELWDDYLSYADIFNIYQQMETWYESGPMDAYPYGYYYYIGRSFRSSYESGVSSRSDGGGGSASFGGGGGASGGGGGGSR